MLSTAQIFRARVCCAAFGWVCCKAFGRVLCCCTTFGWVQRWKHAIDAFHWKLQLCSKANAEDCGNLVQNNGPAQKPITPGQAQPRPLTQRVVYGEASGASTRCKPRGAWQCRKVRGRCEGGAKEVRGRCEGSVREVHGRCEGSAREVRGAAKAACVWCALRGARGVRPRCLDQWQAPHRHR